MTASNFRNSPILTVILGTAACFVVGFIILYPDQILDSSLEGLTIWWKIVFPAMLPLLILVEIMTAMGVMHFIGALLDPVMRRMFRLPGIAGWCIAVGWTAGAPAGVQHIAKLRHAGQLTRQQAERLLALSYAASPVLIVIVIAAGFFQRPELGVPLLIIHWLGALIAALIATGSAADREQQPAVPAQHRRRGKREPGLLRRSLLAMEQARVEDGRSFGRLLGDSVFDSIQKLMIVGGYMIFFAVMLKIISLSGADRLIIQGGAALEAAFGLPAESPAAWLAGFFEQHLGAYALRSAPYDIWSLAALSALLGWSGICLQVQARSAMAGTDLRAAPFLLSRVVHAAAGAVLSFLLFPLLNLLPAAARGLPVWAEWPSAAGSSRGYPDLITVIRFDAWVILGAACGILLLALLSLLYDAMSDAGRRHNG